MVKFAIMPFLNPFGLCFCETVYRFYPPYPIFYRF